MKRMTAIKQGLVRGILSILVLVGASVFLNGCGGAKALKIGVVCEGDCNNNNPVVTWIYQLKDTEKFMSESRESLIQDGQTVLSDDIPEGEPPIRTQLAPGDTLVKIFKGGRNNREGVVELKKETKFIGVVADFFSPDPDKWRAVFPVKTNLGKKIKLNVHFKKNMILLVPSN